MLYFQNYNPFLSTLICFCCSQSSYHGEIILDFRDSCTYCVLDLKMRYKRIGHVEHLELLKKIFVRDCVCQQKMYKNREHQTFARVTITKKEHQFINDDSPCRIQWEEKPSESRGWLDAHLLITSGFALIALRKIKFTTTKQQRGVGSEQCFGVTKTFDTVEKL